MKNMPKTKFEEVVYGLLMSFFMVFAMECYNSARNAGGMSNACFITAIKELAFMWPICFVISFFLMDRIAPKIAFKLVTPGEDKPVFVIVVRAAVTVCLMCPSMSLVATAIFQDVDAEFVARWLQTVVKNFPMAFFWQIFFCGPLVRALFGLIFRRKGKSKEIFVENQNEENNKSLNDTAKEASGDSYV